MDENGNGAPIVDADGFIIATPKSQARNPGDDFTDPADAGTPDGGADSPPKRRGRPPGPNAGKRPGTGTRNSTKAKAVSISVSGLEALLLSIHGGLSVLTSCPELNLDKQSAHELAEASANVAALYNVQLDPKTAAWLALGAISAGVYVPRVLMLRERLAQDTKDKKKIKTPSSGTVGGERVVSPSFNGIVLPGDAQPELTINVEEFLKDYTGN